jgi:hypothetical protein
MTSAARRTAEQTRRAFRLKRTAQAGKRNSLHSGGRKAGMAGKKKDCMRDVWTERLVPGQSLVRLTAALPYDIELPAAFCALQKRD